MSQELIAIGFALFTCLGVALLVHLLYGPKQYLIQTRENLDEHLAQLVKVEETMKKFLLFRSLDEALVYVNSLDCKNLAQLFEKLALKPDDELACNIKTHLQRDVLKHRWETNNPIDERDQSELFDKSGVQRILWKTRRDALRVQCSDLQVIIEELEQLVKARETSSAQRRSAPDPDDKRAQLSRVRVDITKMRLQEQKLEKEILDEQGKPVPHRRASGVPTNDE